MTPFQFTMKIMATRPAYYDWLFNVASNGRIFRASVLEAAKTIDVTLSDAEVFNLKRHFNNPANKRPNLFKETVIDQVSTTLNKDLFDK